MKGCLGLVLGVIVLAVIVGAGSSGSSSSTATTASSPTPTVVKVASHADPMRHCDPNVIANQHASCGFAENTFKAFVEAMNNAPGEGYTLTATSPETGDAYTMRCHEPVNGSLVICGGASDAKVEFPLTAAVAYGTPQAPAPTTSPGEGDTEEEGESGEEDEVGSTSHAGDAKFCEENTCEGDFTGEDGEVVECSDGDYSHAGGISGACSDHGGEASKE